MTTSFDPVEETIGLLERAAVEQDAAGRPGTAAGHRYRAAGLRILLPESADLGARV